MRGLIAAGFRGSLSSCFMKLSAVVSRQRQEAESQVSLHCHGSLLC